MCVWCGVCVCVRERETDRWGVTVCATESERGRVHLTSKLEGRTTASSEFGPQTFPGDQGKGQYLIAQD